MITYLDENADPDIYGIQSYIAGGKMKEAGLDRWNYDSDQVSLEATNESGFTGLPAGSRFHFDGGYMYMGYASYFGSSTELNNYYGWYRSLNYFSSNVARNYLYKQYGFSVRCLGD